MTGCLGLKRWFIWFGWVSERRRKAESVKSALLRGQDGQGELFLSSADPSGVKEKNYSYAY